MSSKERTISKDWHKVGLSDLACPRCSSKGDEEVGKLFIVIPATILHEMDAEVPLSDMSHLFCYTCAIEILTDTGVKMLVNEASSFIHKLGSRRSNKLS